MIQNKINILLEDTRMLFFCAQTNVLWLYVCLQDCSVLAFVLDHLLPHTQNSEDKDTPALARLFLASLAAAGTGTEAQVTLVNEVKAALSRALAMAEGTEKHAR